MMRARYHFDPIELTYVPVDKDSNFLHSLRKRSGMLGASVLFAWVLMFTGVSDWATQMYFQFDNHLMLSQMNRQHQRVGDLEEQLMAVHERDQHLYRSLVDMKPTDPNVWNAGYGGGATFTSIQPKKLQKLAIRLHKLQYQSGILADGLDKVREKALQMQIETENYPVMVPVRGVYVSGFGYRRNPIHGGHHFHQGIDLAAKHGTPVKASGAGVISVVGYPQSGYGLQVQIDHGNGYVTRYAHLSGAKVYQGQKIKRGTVIGLIGTTGMSTGPHLHYEIIHQGKAINPNTFMVIKHS